MHVGVKLGVSLAAAALTGGTLSAGVANAAPQPPSPGTETTQPAPAQQEEGRGPGSIIVGPEGNAKALERLQERGDRHHRWCYGTVLPSQGLNVRTGPGLRHRVVGTLYRGSSVTTDWRSIERRDGYMWVKLRHSRNWIADYRLGNGNGKWYLNYRNC